MNFLERDIDKLRGPLRPEYVFRPQQYLRRASRMLQKVPLRATATLPWGAELQYRPSEVVGFSIWKTGIFELAVCETLWRLLDEGGTALDIGANIGQMTSLLALRAGPTGNVLSFEPHPEVFSDLKANADMAWQTGRAAQIALHNVALSDQAGTAPLNIPVDFSGNRGVATMEAGVGSSVETVSVSVKRLDELRDGLGSIDILKIDVEGHELKVFGGATSCFAELGMTDIVYEDHMRYPSPVSAFLEQKGYTVFNLTAVFKGPVLTPTHALKPGNGSRDYLATRNWRRALARMNGAGWQVLRAGF